MSIPAVNKLRLLAKAAPPLPHPGAIPQSKSPTLTSSTETRGAILAIEGSEDDVRIVTEWLAEFLRNESNEFLVKAFLGPDIGAVMASAKSEEEVDMVGTQQQRYLKAISEWHWVSKEVVKFVTTAPKIGDEAMSENNAARDANQEAEDQGKTEEEDVEIDLDSTSSPTSAVSPRTITQTERLSLKSPTKNISFAADTNDSHSMDYSPPTIISKPPPPPTTAPPPSPPPHSPPFTNQGQKNTHLFPIALLPRYQLSTVDTASLTMPITDSYLPIDHWQWAAALWRGCVGADVTIVVQDERANGYGSVSSGGSVGSAGGSVGSGAVSGAGAGGVEVRLGQGDVRAVIVRKGGSGGGSGSGSGKGSGNGNGEEGERKVVEAGALRRVGFEIIEFLRR